MIHQHRSWLRVLFLAASGLLVVVILAAGNGQVGARPAAVVAPANPAISGPLLHYQARLLDPATSQPKPDGPYQMSFKLYASEVGGLPLWTEAKEVTVSNGVFSTLLGDVTPLNLGVFDGRALWLGITVGADPEATPRQPVAYAAYALYARNAGLLNGQQSSAFAGASHQHAGADISTGVVAEPRIDAALARDDEVLPLVLGRDGAGSGLDADLLDGQQSNAFAGANHSHSAAQITSGVLATDRFSAYEDLTNENRVGSAVGQVAPGNHVHDDRYYVKAEADNRFVNAAGDTMTGILTVPKVAYIAPHIAYYMVGSAAFTPGSNVDYRNTYGNGGANIVSGSGALVADVHLPQGAEVTEFKVFFDDESPSDMIVYLMAEGTSGGFADMAELSSAGITGYGARTTASINLRIIDNTTHSYLVYAYSTNWSSSLQIKGALITYTIDEAP